MSLWSQIKRRVVYPHLAASSEPLSPTIPDHAAGVPTTTRGPMPSLEFARHTYVLIHGSWHDQHAWDQVKAILERQGHTVYAPTLFAHGMDEPPADVELDQIAQPLANELRARDYQNVIVVAWSFGGIVAQRLAELCPELVREVIFLSAYVLRGDSIMEIVANWNPQAVGYFESLVKDGLSSLPREVFATFMPDGSPERQQEVWTTLKPEPWGPTVEKRDFSNFWSMVELDAYRWTAFHLYTAYIEVDNDLALGPGFWSTIADRLGPSCRRVHLPVGAHECLYTQPEALTAAILDVSIGAHVTNNS